MKKSILLFACIALMSIANAESFHFTESFDANSLEWTECANESNLGSAVIDKGVFTIKSKGENKGMGAFLTAMSGVKTTVGQNTFFETHCYAPLDVKKPFTITTHVEIDKLDQDRCVGLVFNYRDGGNFYCFSFNDEMVTFARYVDNEIVGTISQGIKWKKKSDAKQEWELISEDQTLTFKVNGMPILKVHYMPLEYSGFGYYTFGKQTLIVKDVEFVEL